MVKTKKLLLNLFKIFLVVLAGIILFSSTGLMTYVFLSEVSPSLNFNREDLINKIPKAYVIQSGSMEPALKTGSVVITFPAASYVQNDIITFAQNGNTKRLVTHRIVTKLYPEGIQATPKYITGGDANEEFDNWEVKDEHIVGKVVFVVPYAGYVSDFAKKPQGFILLVIIPATIVIYEEMKGLYIDLKRFFSYFWEKVKKRKNNQETVLTSRVHSGSGNEAKNWGLPKIALLTPFLGVLIFMIAFSLGYFTDLEKSLGNILGAATSYGEKQANLYDSNDYTCPTGASTTTTDLGNVFMKISGSTVKVDVVLDGATPSTVYDIWVNQDPGGCPLASPTAPGALTTDVNGDGTASVETPLVVGATNFWISAVGGGQVLRSTAVTLP